MMCVAFARQILHSAAERSFVLLASVLLSFGYCSCWSASQGGDSDFRCGQAVESKIWGAWDFDLKSSLLSGLIIDRLRGKGDTYALYDFQTYTHNLVQKMIQVI